MSISHSDKHSTYSYLIEFSEEKKNKKYPDVEKSKGIKKSKIDDLYLTIQEKKKRQQPDPV